ncbi:YheC/YheD family protein [Paenibacillus ferrarius]|uniref:YheC/YheD family endospore coat-associated protein n=1 Tax=Paenibacillus ferrarius TaxID=1469647 RepID=UPI003D2CAE9F
MRWTPHRRPRLGVMVTERNRPLPFADAAFYRSLSVFGAEQGIEVFVFSPNRIDWAQSVVQGYVYDEAGGWQARQFPLPSLIYDRCFFSSKESYTAYRHHVRKLRARRDIRFLGNGLGGKWEVARMLAKDSALLPYLPETARLHSGAQLKAWLAEKQEAFLKPEGGSQGKGALHVQRTNEAGSERYVAEGRDGRNQPLSRTFPDFLACWQWLRMIIGARPYLLQAYLSLHTAEGIAYDVRSLMQKNGRGLWEMTGVGVRAGKPGSLTSNLHGGGKAEEVSSFLTRQFGDAKAKELLSVITELSLRIPPLLENDHGRLVELGLDFGIDTQGRIWILEINSKPGRTLFAELRNERARADSIANPIRYARFLLH